MSSDASETTPPGLRGFLRRQILKLDDRLRQDVGVIEFTAGPECILRVALIEAEAQVRLADGFVIERGDPVIELHFWNERLPQAPVGGGAGIGWAARFGRLLMLSFRDLAIGVEADPRLHDAKAVLARLAFAGERNRGDAQRFGLRFGFETTPVPAPVPLARRFHDFWEDIWLVLLTWAFNPGSLKGRSVLRLREDLWMSRDNLVARFAGKTRGRDREKNFP